jgi:hypothetical protein
MKPRFRVCVLIVVCLAIGITQSASAQDRFESAPGPELKPPPKQEPHPRVPRRRPEPEPTFPPPPVAVLPPSPIAPAPQLPQPPPRRFDEAALFGRWCSADIQFTLTPSEWRYQLPDGQSTVFHVTTIQALSDTATVSFQDENGTIVNEFHQIDNNTILQFRGKHTMDTNWHYYNRSFRRC